MGEACLGSSFFRGVYYIPGATQQLHYSALLCTDYIPGLDWTQLAWNGMEQRPVFDEAGTYICSCIGPQTTHKTHLPQQIPPSKHNNQTGATEQERKRGKKITREKQNIPSMEPISFIEQAYAHSISIHKRGGVGRLGGFGTGASGKGGSLASILFCIGRILFTVYRLITRE